MQELVSTDEYAKSRLLMIFKECFKTVHLGAS